MILKKIVLKIVLLNVVKITFVEMIDFNKKLF